jgi:hypothetical protein
MEHLQGVAETLLAPEGRAGRKVPDEVVETTEVVTVLKLSS